MSGLDTGARRAPIAVLASCFLGAALFHSGCGSDDGAGAGATVPAKDAGAGGAAVDGGGGGGGAAPTCGPLATIAFAPAVPGTFAGKPGAHCERDIDCVDGSFCVVVTETCATAAMLEGPGKGGHLPGGGACLPAPAFPASCEDALALEWTPATDISKSPGSLAESDTSLVTDGHGKVLVAWANNTKGAREQFNGLALSTDDGKTFKSIPAPSHLATDAENDAALAIDGQGLFYYVWEGYADNFKGAQHVWSSTSKDGSTWSAALQIDTAGDDGMGTIPLDFPSIAVNPVNQKPYYTYQITSNGSPVPMKLVVGAAGGASVTPSVELDDGTRPAVYRDLGNGVFDAKGNYYAAWIELAGSGGNTGRGLESGSTGNAIYFTRIDLAAGGGLAPLGHDVKVSGKGEASLFGIPQILSAKDGAAQFVVYATGVKNAIDVRVATSHDGGLTWAPSVKVNDDASCATHYDASAALDEKGRLWVLWYDNRDGDGHLVYSVSDDGGKTFHPNRLVTPFAFPFENFQYSVGWLGDYFQVIASGGQLYAAWSDPHEDDQSHIDVARALLPK